MLTPSRILTLCIALIASAGSASAQCYLMDANADCSVCWRTTYGSKNDTTGVTTVAQCPEGVKVASPPPAGSQGLYIGGVGSLACCPTSPGL